MCGNNYCATCEPDAFMVAWTDGHHHITPRFGDYNQQYVAERKRLATFRAVMSADYMKAKEFPEFLSVDKTLIVVNSFAAVVTPYFSDFCRDIAGFSRYIADHPRKHRSEENGRTNRKRRLRANRMHRPHLIARFIITIGGLSAVQQMSEISGVKSPAWLTPARPEAPRTDQPALEMAA